MHLVGPATDFLKAWAGGDMCPLPATLAGLRFRPLTMAKDWYPFIPWLLAPQEREFRKAGDGFVAA